MSTPSATTDREPPTGLVFSGSEPGIIPWTLMGFIILSAVVHAFGFFLFQTVYPAAARLRPPPTQVGLLMPGTPEADAILRWVDANDPSLAAQPAKAAIPKLMALPYIPSYATVHARPTMASAPAESLPEPEGIGGLDLVKIAAGTQPPRTQAVTTASTTLVFSAPLVLAGPLPSLASLHPSDVSEALPPARFLIGVADTGAVQYIFQQDSSGDKALDAGAGNLLQQTRFHSSAEPLSWGFATFHWGSAIYAESSPAPQSPP